MSITRQMPRWQCLAFVALNVLVLAACQDPTKPELTTPGVSLAYQGAPVSTFTVNSSDDVDDGTCDAIHCSLREAIKAANASNGFDAIEFNIPAMSDAGCNAGTGVCTIRPVLISLPIITDPVVIDGYTQPGASPNTNPVGLGLNTVLKIEVDGSLLGGSAFVLSIRAPNSTVRGLVINRAARGIEMRSLGPNIVEGNFIGTDVTGTMALGNGLGMDVVLGNNRIGGTTPAARNLISGNTTQGIQLFGRDNNENIIVQGNLIGTDVTGTVALGNGNIGVFTQGSSNVIGGTAPGARNVISGNNCGVCLGSAGQVNGNRVQGNFIGTDITGTVALGNGIGVSLGGTINNTIGGTAPGAGNVISGSRNSGVQISAGSTGNRVEGNFIGTDTTGTIDLGNGLSGVSITGGGSNSNNTIGGMAPGAGNIIAYNGNAGVAVRTAASTGNAILSNAIFANHEGGRGLPGLGIDLATSTGTFSLDGVTPNDPGDGDTGGNNLQNFPVLTSALTTPGRLVVRGTIDTPNPETATIEFFANPVPTPGGDPSGHGEGAVFLGRASPSPQGQIFAVLPAVDLGTLISATATDAAGNTSEFAANIQVTARGRGRP